MHVTLWVPAAGDPRWPCVDSWMNIDWPCEHSFVRNGPNNIKYSWNEVVRNFLATKSDYLWSCHNDVTFQPGTLKRLLSWGKPLVSAMIFHKAGPALPHIWEGTVEGQVGFMHRTRDTVRWFLVDHKDAIGYGCYLMEPRPDDALVPVDFTSTGCLLIHRSVLERLEDPWFLCDDDYRGQGEDRRFFQNAKAIGIEGYVDRSCIAGHLSGDHPSGPIDFLWWVAITTDPNAAKPGSVT